MIITYLQKPLAGILIALLLLNLTQRKSLSTGEKKRYATLYLALIVLFLYTAAVTIQRQGWSGYFLFPALAVSLLAALHFRKRIFIFDLRCPECKKFYSLKEILYNDTPVCGVCKGKASAKDPARETIPLSVESVDWENWAFSEEAVLCYIVHNGRVLLMHKKTGLGKGKINAPGGRIEPGETPLEAAVRETEEEVGLTPHGLEKRMDLHFLFTDGYSLKGHVYFADSYTGELKETEEADPFWISLEEIPYARMWADDEVWLPKALSGEKLKGFFIFDQDEMKSHKIIPLLS